MLLEIFYLFLAICLKLCYDSVIDYLTEEIRLNNISYMLSFDKREYSIWTDGDKYYIFDKDPDNLPLPHLANGDYDVPENKLLLVSWDVTSSFDSRYFGPVDNKLVRKKVLPLLVLPQFH